MPNYKAILTADEKALLEDWERGWDGEDGGDAVIKLDRRKTPRVPFRVPIHAEVISKPVVEESECGEYLLFPDEIN